MLAKYFEDPSDRLASLIDRLETAVDEADSTGRISSNAVQELRLVVSMLPKPAPIVSPLPPTRSTRQPTPMPH